MLTRQACAKFQRQIFDESEVIQILKVVRWHFCQVYGPHMNEWPPIGKIAAHSAYDMFHGISTRLLVWFFPTSVFGVGIFF